MTARREVIVEQLTALNEKISVTVDPTIKAELTAQRDKLIVELSDVNSMLSESNSVIKG